MTDRELMQWALDALDGYARNCRCEGGGGTTDAAEALRARLAQPDLATVGEVGVWGEQEPVCWVYPGFFDDLSEVHCGTAYRLPSFARIPLYTAPQYKENNDDKS